MTTCIIRQANAQDVTIHSLLTGHDWMLVSYYDNPGCRIFHRYNARYPFHRQKGHYVTLDAAMDYIQRHELYTRTMQGEKKQRRREKR